MPLELTTEIDNHRHAFIGMVNGDIYIFDTHGLLLSTYTIELTKVLGNKAASDAVSDIKCHP